MAMTEEPASVSLTIIQPVSGCDLCTSENVTSTAGVVVQHPRGGLVQFAACDWCVQTLRRLSAATGGFATVRLTSATRPFHSNLRTRRPPTAPVLVLELSQPVQGYVVQVYGRERFDGTWEGWLEFVSEDGRSVLRTGRETTQSKREDLGYWSTGLEPSYVQGAFERARPWHMTAVAS